MDTWPKDYFVPNFGMDVDAKASLSNTNNAETSLGHTWVPPKSAGTLKLMQKESIPACNSFECAKKITAAPGHLAGLWEHDPEARSELQLKHHHGHKSIPACTSYECKKETAAPTKLQAD